MDSVLAVQTVCYTPLQSSTVHRRCSWVEYDANSTRPGVGVGTTTKRTLLWMITTKSVAPAGSAGQGGCKRDKLDTGRCLRADQAHAPEQPYRLPHPLRHPPHHPREPKSGGKASSRQASAQSAFLIKGQRVWKYRKCSSIAQGRMDSGRRRKILPSGLKHGDRIKIDDIGWCAQVVMRKIAHGDIKRMA